MPDFKNLLKLQMPNISRLKLISLVIISILVVTTGIYFTFLKEETKQTTPIINAVPTDAGFIVETKDFKTFIRLF